MNLLNNSMDQLTRVLLENKRRKQDAGQFDVTQREGTRRFDASQSLERELMGMRREDTADARAVRREGLDLQKQNHADAKENRGQQLASLEEYRKALASEKNEERKAALLKSLLQSPYLPPEGRKAIETKLTEVLGLNVTLGKPPAKQGFNTRAGHDLELAQEYEAKAAAAEAAGDMAKAAKLRGYAAKLESSVGREDPLTLGGAEPEGGPAGPASLEDALLQSKTKPMQTEIDDHLSNISKGDASYGFLNLNDRASRVRELEPQLRALTNRPTATVPGQLNTNLKGTTAPKTNVLLGGVTGSLPKVTSKAEFDALPSGAKYIGRDGRPYQKP
jgi:hypothetical protein